MEIREFRVQIAARDFESSCHFYGETLGLPKVEDWQDENGRGAAYATGSGVVEVLGPTAGGGRDERFDYQGPDQKMVLEMIVPSAQKAYEELQFREKNIPGGLRKIRGVNAFVTHDPDGVKVVYREPTPVAAEA